jgi:uncharacterized protein YndB with AHSA1/START domain
MDKGLIAQAEITIKASPERVWEALTTPRLIKQYFFGSDVASDWKVGSPITYRGEWQGKAYEDKGEILQVLPGKLLISTHWSPLSGTPDAPENYHTVSYELTGEADNTAVRIRQDNNASEDEVKHSAENWKMVLEGLKVLLEGPDAPSNTG